MRLSQTEVDRVLIFNVAEMARRRRARGLRLNHPEAVALITDTLMEAARDGRSYEEVRAVGLAVLAPEDVLPGVPALARGLTCEPVFEDGPRIIVLPDPIAGGRRAGDPGERLLADGAVTLNAGRDAVELEVRNGSDHVVNVSSHYHFYEVNPRMTFNRDAAYGRHLDIQAGRSVVWTPGETKVVRLVAYAGRGVVDGFQRRPPPAGVDAPAPPVRA